MPEDHVVLEGIHDPVDDLQTLLSNRTLQPANCQSASDYLAIDGVLETGELPSEEDITALVEGATDQDNDDNDAEDDQDDHIAPPTLKQAVDAAKVLQSFFDSKEDEESSWAIVGLNKKLEDIAARQKVQTSLFDYFHSK